MSSNTPPGFRYMPGLVDLDFDQLSQSIEWEQRAIRLYGRSIPLPRLTAMYGAPYTYSGISHPARPLPRLLDALRARMADLAGAPFDAVLCNLYRGGSDSVSWHDDNDYPTAHPQIASLSFGATRRFLVRSKGDRTERYTFHLEHGSALIMSGRSQIDYQHSVPKTKRAVGPRINLTFRCMGA